MSKEPDSKAINIMQVAAKESVSLENRAKLKDANPKRMS
jgi:hypothetical protein